MIDSTQTLEDLNLTVSAQPPHWLLHHGINFSQENGIICKQSEWELDCVLLLVGSIIVSSR